MIWHLPESWCKHRVWTLRRPLRLDVAFSGVFAPGDCVYFGIPRRCRPAHPLWFLRGWRLGWDRIQRGVIVSTPVCVVEIVRSWIPF